MKITSFHPVIATNHADQVIKFFEALGFEKAHVKTDIVNEDSYVSTTNTVMYDDANHAVEITSVGNLFHETDDTLMIHINVDDLDEAVTFMTSMGFKEVTRASSASADYCTVAAPSGFKIDLCQHIRK